MRYQGCWLLSLDRLQHIHWVGEYWRRPRFWGKVFSLLLVKVWGACEAYLSGLGIGNWHHEQGWDYLWRVGIVLRGNPPVVGWSWSAVLHEPICSSLPIAACHVGNLKQAMVEIFTIQKLAKTSNFRSCHASQLISSMLFKHFKSLVRMNQ